MGHRASCCMFGKVAVYVDLPAALKEWICDASRKSH